LKWRRADQRRAIWGVAADAVLPLPKPIRLLV
jgi:hypothetical protein